MQRHTLYAYVDGSDLDTVAVAIEGELVEPLVHGLVVGFANGLQILDPGTASGRHGRQCGGRQRYRPPGGLTAGSKDASAGAWRARPAIPGSGTSASAEKSSPSPQSKTAARVGRPSDNSCILAKL